MAAALGLVDELREGSHDAVVGIGGGRTLDVAKYAASQAGLPMVSVATNLAHDGIASPVASLEDEEGRKGSFGVHIPIAVVVDLDYVRRSPEEQLRSGIGDALSNLSALADWEVAAEDRGEPIDGLAATFARSGAESLLRSTDDLASDSFQRDSRRGTRPQRPGHGRRRDRAARAAARATRSRTRSTPSIPDRASHGEQVAVGALFASFLREDGLFELARRRPAPPRRRPRCPGDLGLSEEEFAAAVAHAPTTRPGPVHDPRAPRPRRGRDPRPGRHATSMPSIAELRAETQPDWLLARPGAEHWAGPLYMRRVSPYVTRLSCARRYHGERRHLAHDPRPGCSAPPRSTIAGSGPRCWRALHPAPAPPRLLATARSRAGAKRVLPGRRLPRPDRALPHRGGLPAALGVRAAGGWDSLDGWDSLGLLVAVLVLLIKAETQLVRSRSGESGCRSSATRPRRPPRAPAACAGSAGRWPTCPSSGPSCRSRPRCSRWPRRSSTGSPDGLDRDPDPARRPACRVAALTAPRASSPGVLSPRTGSSD